MGEIRRERRWRVGTERKIVQFSIRRQIMSAQMHVISGFVGGTPETREVETSRGKQSVTTLNLAINNPRDREAEPTWYRVTMWNGLGKAVQQYVDTGSYLVVTSDRLSVSTWLNQDM
jgi:single-strand DNA-binding protein